MSPADAFMGLGAASGSSLKNGLVGWQSQEDASDRLTSVSQTPSLESSRLSQPTPGALRDRLLREARNERQRCLEVAEAAERRRLELRAIRHASVQTEAVIIADADIGRAELPRREAWGKDDEAQAEALKAISMLGQFGDKSREAESSIRKLDLELRAERQRRQDVEVLLGQERGRKEAAQGQVLCLEYELDGKEAALQAAERMLEQRDLDLMQVQQRLQALRQEWR